VHLRPNADVAERALLPGDPGRALRLAQALLEAPKMLNHHRGLWGYTGLAADGRPLTIQSTGMGGPSAAIVAEELIGLGVRRLIRVGTCGALTDDARLGDLVIAESALCEDGASRALGADGTATPDPDLLDALRRCTPNGALAGPIVSTDLFYDPDPARWRHTGALARDLETAALLTVASRRDARAASVLAVRRSGEGVIEPDALEAAELELGRLAVDSLT
jgi:DeoD family purine-nucleoside phosphorylase